MGPSTSEAAADHQGPAASWLAVATIGVGAFALVTTEFLPVGLLPKIAQSLGVTEGVAGLSVMTPGFVAAVAAPATIGLAAGFDRRKVLLFLLGLLALSNLVVALAPNFTTLLIGRVLLGLAVGGFWTIGGSLGPRLRPGAEGPKASALILSGVSVGTVAGVPAAALLGEAFGWRSAFVVAAVMAGVVALALSIVLPSIKPQSSQGLRGLPDVMRLPKVRLGSAAAVLIFIGQFAGYTYITPFLNQVSGVTAGALSAVLLGYGATGFLGNIVGGWIASRDVRVSVIAMAILTAGSVALLALTGANPIAAVIAVLAWGLAFGMLPITMQTWMFNAAPDRLENVGALFVSVAQLSIGAGALVGGLVVDRAGVVSAMWVAAASAVATGLLIGLAGGRASSNAEAQAVAAE